MSSLASTLSEFTQGDPIIYFYEVNIESSGDTKNGNGMVYWFPKTHTFGLWTYNADYFYESILSNAERQTLVRASNEIDTERKWLNSLKREAIQIENVNNEFAEMRYLTKKHRLEIVNDPEFVSERLRGLILAFQEEVQSLKEIVDEARGPRKEMTRKIEKQGTQQQSLRNRNLRKRPNVGLGPQL